MYIVSMTDTSQSLMVISVEFLCTCIVLIHVMLFQYLELLFLCYRHYKCKIDCQEQKLGVMIYGKIYV